MATAFSRSFLQPAVTSATIVLAVAQFTLRSVSMTIPPTFSASAPAAETAMHPTTIGNFTFIGSPSIQSSCRPAVR